MDIQGKVFIVTGGASGLGEGTARMLARNGGKVVIADLQADKGEAVAKELGGVFVKCAGIAPAAKTVGKDGAHALALFAKVVTVNLVGSFNMIRLAAEAMAKNE